MTARRRAIAFLPLALAAAFAVAGSPAAAPVLPFVADDLDRAIAEGRARGVPVFVDAWAPWCHTCRSMWAFTFSDPALAPRASEFVWLSIDTEKKGNAPFLAKYPVEAWPTLFVIDPKTEKAVLRWVGGATVPELQKILDDARLALGPAPSGLDAALARADALYGDRKNAEAAKAYRDVLSRAPPNWKSTARATGSLLLALKRAGDPKACAKTARKSFPGLADTSAAASVAEVGLRCAMALPPGGARSDLVAALAADARAVVARPPAGSAADDVSSVYDLLADERGQARDEAGRLAVLRDWAAYLEAEAASAKTPEGRAVFDSHRLSVYIALGEPEKAIPMLLASKKDFPDDYNPSARLALAYEAMKDYDRALGASDGALSKAYGPRKITILVARSRIHREQGDLVSARIALEEAIREAEALPPAQRSDAQVAMLKQKLGEIPL